MVCPRSDLNFELRGFDIQYTSEGRSNVLRTFIVILIFIPNILPEVPDQAIHEQRVPLHFTVTVPVG